MKTLIVIPARYQSKRFPGKPLQPIAGVSMLARTVSVAQHAGRTSGAQVVVATDDERIAEHAKAIGAAAVMTDPELPSGTDRARAAMQLVAPDANFVVNLQGDAPFTPPGHVAALIENAAKGDVVTPVVQLPWDKLEALRMRKQVTPFSGTTCIRSAEGRALWFSKNILPAMRNEAKLREAGGPSPVFQHIGLYGYSRGALEAIAQLKPSHYEELEGLEQLRFIENGLSVFAVAVEPADMPMSGIDTKDDLLHAEAMLKQFGDPYRS